jgi:hypothetical protein
MVKRPTIKQQQEIAAKNKKSIPAASESTPAASESTDTESIASEAVDCDSETNVRDKQVNVKFTSDDLIRLKKAAKDAHRPVANYIYSAIMDKISGDGY